MKVAGKEAYKELRNQGKAVIFFVWLSNNCWPSLQDDDLERERQKTERLLIELDKKADRFYG